MLNWTNPHISANISTVIASTLFFLAILTYTKKSKVLIGYRFLSLFLFFTTLNFTDEALTISGTYLRYPGLMLIFQPGTYAIAPAFYMATLYLTSPGKKLNIKVLLHFIPYLLLLVLCMLTFLIPADIVAAGKPKANHIEMVTVIFMLTLLFIQIFSYLFLAMRQLRKHRQSIPLFLSNLSGNDYQWLSQILMGLCLLAVTWLIEVIAQQPLLSLFASMIYLCSFYYIGVKIMKQKDVVSFSPGQNEQVEDLAPDQEFAPLSQPASTLHPEASSLKKKVLTDEKVVQLKEQLLELMRNDKPYLDSEITLPRMSKMMLSNTYHLSYLLNDCLEENFYSFINRYRIDECMRLLKDPAYDHLTILGIAFECGFSSKTSFNSSFKKITGLSPAAYKKQHSKKTD